MDEHNTNKLLHEQPN